MKLYILFWLLITAIGSIAYTILNIVETNAIPGFTVSSSDFIFVYLFCFTSSLLFLSPLLLLRFFTSESSILMKNVSYLILMIILSFFYYLIFFRNSTDIIQINLTYGIVGLIILNVLWSSFKKSR